MSAETRWFPLPRSESGLPEEHCKLSLEAVESEEVYNAYTQQSRNPQGQEQTARSGNRVEHIHGHVE